ncbi:MAG: LPP20 family lipoprotein [Flavobacteriaceae bacterium]|nr:LPP20 family lipoprotein [Flavobacteriales bacterium]MDP4665611.1 LPP20 family lipoprotein [Flavobacteriaceae bacterium]
MKALQTTFFGFLMLALVGMFSNCSTPMQGTKVKEPFSSSKYESNNRWFRAVGKGVSVKDNVAKGKADIEAKRELAQQVQTTVKVVTDQFLADTQTANGSEINDKFQTLIREVTNTEIGDLRKIGEEKYFDGENYTVYIAYEIKKNAMLRFLKKKAKTDAKIDKVTADKMAEILDREIERLESEEGED